MAKIQTVQTGFSSKAVYSCLTHPLHYFCSSGANTDFCFPLRYMRYCLLTAIIDEDLTPFYHSSLFSLFPPKSLIQYFYTGFHYNFFL